MVKVVAAGVKQRKKAKPKPKLTDEERHARFVEMAREVEASESAESFDRAFDAAVGSNERGKSNHK